MNEILVEEDLITDDKELKSLSLGELTEKLKIDMSSLNGLWNIFETQNLYNKEVNVRLSFPYKQVSSFIIVKQLTISWKKGEDTVSPWKLHLQALAIPKDYESKEDSEIVTRIIWSREGKYYHKMSAFVKPSAMELLNNLSQCFRFSSSKIEDLTFPF